MKVPVEDSSRWKYKLIIFDLDDTLFDYSQTEETAVGMACRASGIAPWTDLYPEYRRAHAMVRCQFNSLDADNIHAFRIERARTFLTLAKCRYLCPEAFVKNYLGFSTVGILIDGVAETLQELRGIRKVVATNGTNHPRREKLNTSSIAQHFDAFFSAEDLGVSKPNPRFFESIISQYGLTSRDVLIVGDDQNMDIVGAARLGVDSCWFNHRNRPTPPSVDHNVSTITRFCQLISLLRA